MSQDLPWENLDVFLDIPRLRIRKPHDDFEKLFTVSFGLGYRERSEPFEVTSNPVLLLNGEAHSDERLKQEDRVNARHVTVFLLLPPDAADADTVGLTVLWCHGLKVGMDGASVLSPSELNETALRIPLLDAPLFRHQVKVAIEFQDRLGGVHGIRIE